jgi:hypothetical protein
MMSDVTEVFTVFSQHPDSERDQFDIDGDGVGQLAMMVANYALLRGATEQEACEDVLLWLNDPGKKLDGFPLPLADRVFVDKGRVLVVKFTMSRNAYKAALVPQASVPR